MAKQINPDHLDTAFDLPSDEAISYMRSKGFAVTWNWDEARDEAHHRAFTVAKAMQMDVLSDIRSELERAQREGLTLEEFRDTLEPRLKAKGWWGEKLLRDPSTGKKKRVELGSPRRLETIYRTNMQSAYMAGRMKQQAQLAVTRPYWQYLAVSDSRTTSICSSLHQKVYHADDPFWSTAYPPNHFNCRARVRSLSEKQMAREGHTVRSGEESDFEPAKGFASNPLEVWQPDLQRYPKDLSARYRTAMKSAPPPPKPQPPPELDPLAFAPLPEIDAESVKHHTRSATMQYAQGQDADVQLIEKDLFGRKLTRQEYAGITGAPDGASIVVRRYGDGIQMRINHANYEETSQRTIYRNSDGRLEMHNDLLMLDKATDPPKRMGTRIFATQVIQARALGIELITVDAAGHINHPRFNGYYTWPRVGYDGPIPTSMKPHLPKHLKAATRIMELMQDEKGAAAWKKHGNSLSLEFDLSDGSNSVSFLRDVLKRTGIRL